MDHLKRFVIWFISGAGLAAGVALVIWVVDRSASKASASTEVINIVPTTDFVVSSVAPIPITRDLVVSGQVQNKSNDQPDVSLTLQIRKNATLLYECRDTVESSPTPGKSLRFQIACPEVDPQRLPADATFHVEVGVRSLGPRLAARP
jgi:hypothetical protein